VSNIPIIDIADDGWEEELQFALSTTGGSSDYRNDRERPYNGEAQTDDGVRGSAPIVGLTFRDVRDCFVKGLLLCCGADQPELYERAEMGTWTTPDIWKVDLSKIDPLAVAQNMSCEMEKMMGIYPNCPPLDIDAFLNPTEEEIRHE